MDEETKFLIKIGGVSMVLSIMILSIPLALLTEIVRAFFDPIQYFCYLLTLPFWVFLYVRKCFKPLCDRFLLFLGKEKLKKILNRMEM